MKFPEVMLPEPWRLRTVGALIVVEGAGYTVVVVAGKHVFYDCFLVSLEGIKSKMFL